MNDKFMGYSSLYLIYCLVRMVWGAVMVVSWVILWVTVFVTIKCYDLIFGGRKR